MLTSSLAILALALVVAAGCGGGGSSASTGSSQGQSTGGSINQIVARLETAGYQVSKDRPITHQIEDNAGRKYTPTAALTIVQPGTDVFVNLSMSSDPQFIRAFKQQDFRAVAVRGDRAYGVSSAGSGGPSDLAKVVRTAEGG